MKNKDISVVEGKIDIIYKPNHRHKMTLKDVRSISDLMINLIFFNIIDDYGLYITFDKWKWKLTNKSLNCAKGGKYNTLYHIDIQILIGDTNIGYVFFYL